MDFFESWAESVGNGGASYPFIYRFLTDKESSSEVFTSGTEEAQRLAFDLLKSYNMDTFIKCVEWINIDRNFAPSDVPCFSTFKNGAVRAPEILMFTPNGLTFQQLGYQLSGSIKKTGQIKYGENHSKLAAMMNLVTFGNVHPTIIKATPWGCFLSTHTFEECETVLKALLLRDRFLQSFVQDALSGQASYRGLTKCLSDSTAYRRRTNVKELVKFILEKTEHEVCLNNIDWQV